MSSPITKKTKQNRCKEKKNVIKRKKKKTKIEYINHKWQAKFKFTTKKLMRRCFSVYFSMLNCVLVLNYLIRMDINE